MSHPTPPQPEPVSRTHGWTGTVYHLRDSQVLSIRERLVRFVPDASPEQVRAWDDSIAILKQQSVQLAARDRNAERDDVILEYQVPFESRRIDAIVLHGPRVVVLEFKGRSQPGLADLDQVSAYARDLRCYHRECEGRPVDAVLVATRAKGRHGVRAEVHVIGRDSIDELLSELEVDASLAAIPIERFLSEEAYRPLPSLIQAARDLFEKRPLPRIKRAHAATKPALMAIQSAIREAAASKSRKLVLLTGVPGAGKTLVGLQLVHAPFLDELAVPRADGTVHSPAVFLSGNGPLVTVLQYELRDAGGDGKAFVRGVRDYMKRHTGPRKPAPTEHVLVFDEAQRAWDAEQARAHHKDPKLRSEPEHFIEIAERAPDWCVVVGLVGTGQEIHVGEEGGLGQWAAAIEQSHSRDAWQVITPPQVAHHFAGLPHRSEPSLHLDTGLRYHAAGHMHEFVRRMLDGESPDRLTPLGQQLASDGYHLRISRSLESAKRYLWTRYSADRDKRFGLLMSARDKVLTDWGVSPGEFRRAPLSVGRWYGEPEDTPSEISCRHLRLAITEFQAQGLELDAALVAWGTDLRVVRTDDGQSSWSIEFSTRYRSPKRIKDPLQLRKNAYRVLLTRGREATVVFVPPVPSLDFTFEMLSKAGFVNLDAAPGVD